MHRSTFRRVAYATALSSTIAGAQQPAKPDSVTRLGAAKVVAERADIARVTPIQLTTLPAIATVAAPRIIETVNILDTEDAAKYLPSVFLRKRNNGDTQATMGTRVWGVGSSARSLVFADGVPLSALIANNNNIGGPRWGLVGPTEIARVDMMYGPFSAAYAGNSMGAVMEITTRLPERREGTISTSYASQAFDLYGTKASFPTLQTAASLGDRFGKFAFWLSGSYQKSESQPLAYVTSVATPNGTAGGFTETNKLGTPANVLGATGLLHTGMTNAKVKLAYDLSPELRLAYTFGEWANDGTSGTDTYITRAGAPTYNALAAFATGTSDIDQRHSAHSISLRTSSKGDWDWEVVASRYRMDRDVQRFPVSASSTGLTFSTPGRVTVLTGSAWTTFDAKAAWHAGGPGAEHTVSFGVHHDGYSLRNPTYNTNDWKNGVYGPDVAPTGGAFSAIVSEGDGRTRTQALWAQDAWRIAPEFQLTLGGRFEAWRAFDGYNANGVTSVRQPNVDASRFSPKGVLSWTPNADWTTTLSVGKAYRFATAAELFQLVTTGSTFSSPNPNLNPDDVLATELRAERRYERGRVQLALFNDDIHDALISQFLPLVPGSNVLYSYVSNVTHVRATGAEFVFGLRNVGMRGLEWTGSATYVDARVVALQGQASATAPAGSAKGKFLPNIPRWRGTMAATYRPNTDLSFSLAGRYSDKVYTTLDNADVHFNTYQGFEGWFVADAKALYRFSSSFSASLGVDNVLNRKYFLFHPFPQRTLVGSVSYAF